MRLRTAAAMIAVTLAVAVSGCGTPESETEQDYLRQISIQDHQFAGAADTEVTAGIFVGTPTASLVTAVSGPDLAMREASSEMSDPLVALVALGTGKASSGADCSVQVYRLRPGRPALPDWPLSADQRRQVDSGGLELVRVAVGCPFDS